MCQRGISFRNDNCDRSIRNGSKVADLTISSSKGPTSQFSVFLVNIGRRVVLDFWKLRTTRRHVDRPTSRRPIETNNVSSSCICVFQQLTTCYYIHTRLCNDIYTNTLPSQTMLVLNQFSNRRRQVIWACIVNITRSCDGSLVNSSDTLSIQLLCIAML